MLCIWCGVVQALLVQGKIEMAVQSLIPPHVLEAQMRALVAFEKATREERLTQFRVARREKPAGRASLSSVAGGSAHGSAAGGSVHHGASVRSAQLHKHTHTIGGAAVRSGSSGSALSFVQHNTNGSTDPHTPSAEAAASAREGAMPSSGMKVGVFAEELELEFTRATSAGSQASSHAHSRVPSSEYLNVAAGETDDPHKKSWGSISKKKEMPHLREEATVQSPRTEIHIEILWKMNSRMWHGS